MIRVLYIVLVWVANGHLGESKHVETHQINPFTKTDCETVLVVWDAECLEAGVTETHSPLTTDSQFAEYVQAGSHLLPEYIASTANHRRNLFYADEPEYAQNRQLRSLSVSARRDVVMAQMTLVAQNLMQKSIQERQTMRSTRNFYMDLNDEEKMRTPNPKTHVAIRDGKFSPNVGRMSVDGQECTPLEASVHECKDISQERTMDGKFMKHVDIDVIKTPCSLNSEDLIMIAESFMCVKTVEKNTFVAAPTNVGGSDNESTSLSNERNLSDKEQRQAFVPSDPEFGKQWHLQSSNPNSVKADAQWMIYSGAETPVEIGIVDSAIFSHADLWDNIVTFADEADPKCNNKIDDGANGYVDDCHGWDPASGDNVPFQDIGNETAAFHGTSVAGAVAARAHNNYGVAGVCPFCKIVPTKTHTLEDQGISLAGVVGATDYLIARKIRIGNNSYGGYGVSAAAEQAMKKLSDAGHLIVAAAGNEACDLTQPKCTTPMGEIDFSVTPPIPASYMLENMLVVGATTSNGSKAIFSNYGSNLVDIFCPGFQIYSALPNGGYDFVSGTSFSSPICAGVAAYYMGLFPQMTAKQVKDAVLSAFTPIPALTGLAKSGGVPDMVELSKNSTMTDTFPASNTPTSMNTLPPYLLASATTTVAPTTTSSTSASVTLFKLSPVAFVLWIVSVNFIN